MVVNPACGQLNRKHLSPPVPVRLRVWSGETGSAVPCRANQLILYTEAESGGLLIHRIPPAFRDGVHLL